ncbi:MAG: AAA family ATPase [Colwellia sp.]|nr:AAA family ATPase [Colwellia sp.]
MGLRGVKPKPTEKRLKLFLFGPANIGKTISALQFPDNYIMDLEKGTDFYNKTINKNRSVVFQNNDPEEIKAEVKTLVTTKHDFLTVTFDPFTQYYNAVQEKWTERFNEYARSKKESDMQDHGMRYWAKVKSEIKSTQRLLLAGDFNLIVTAHQKDIYGPGMSKIGVSFDSMKGDQHIYDYVFRLDMVNGKRMAIKEKERCEIGEDKFPNTFEWSYDNFKKYYGQDILEKKHEPLLLASEGQIKRVKEMINLFNVSEDDQKKWLKDVSRKVKFKIDIESFEDVPQENIQKFIDFYDDKIKSKIPKKEVKNAN